MLNHNFKKISVNLDSTIRDAIKVINSFPQERTILIIDGHRLIGLATEGDIRRSLLAGCTLDDPVLKIANKKPILYQQGLKLQNRVVYPKIEEDFLKGYYFKNESTEISNFSALIMAGGFGTRLMPLTSTIPKPMIKVNKKPILERIIEHLGIHEIKQFYISTYYLSDVIIDYFKDGMDWGVKIEYLNESKPLGTGGCLTLLERPQNLILVNGDILTNLNYTQLVEHHLDSKKDLTICVRNYHLEVPFGVVYGNENVTSIVEKPRNQYLINSGIYVINKALLERIMLTPTPFDITTAINQVITDGAKIGMYHLNDFWIDIGNPDELKKAEEVYAL